MTTQEQVTQLTMLLQRAAGLDFNQYKADFFLKCIERRMQALAIPDANVYIRYIAGHPDESGQLLEACTVYHSRFLRDPDKYRVLSSLVLPEVMRSKSAGLKSLNIWSAGCAGGEEPYSIAMTVSETLGANAPAWLVRIQATDMNGELLNKAGTGIYPAEELNGVPAALIGRYFKPAGCGYEVAASLRQLVTFNRHNLIADRPLRALDIIFCRNVMIYFNAEAVRAVTRGFYGALNEGGYLFLGNSEIMDDFFYCHFRKVKMFGEFVYRKISEGSDEFREMQGKAKQIKAGLGIQHGIDTKTN